MRAFDPATSARIAAEWAIETENPRALADSLALYMANGGSLEKDDPLSALEMIADLRRMPGGVVLAEDLLATRARGQFGGAPRIDIVLTPDAEHTDTLRLVSGEITWIEARLWRGAQGADIDLELRDPNGRILAADLANDTGTEGIAAFIEVWAERCMDATLRVVNSGTAAGRVAILIPQSANATCEDSE